MTANPKVVEFFNKQTAFQDRADTAIDGALADAKAQQNLIDELQARPDGWTPEDQALLDQIEQRADAQVQKLEALDAMTPPTPPTEPPTG
jgi:hypothetical protein